MMLEVDVSGVLQKRTYGYSRSVCRFGVMSVGCLLCRRILLRSGRGPGGGKAFGVERQRPLIFGLVQNLRNEPLQRR